MASGAIVGQIISVLPPATLFPQPYVRQGGSTPVERVLVYGFDAATAEYLDFLVLLRGYAGGGLTIAVAWSAFSAITGNTIWRIGIRRIQDDAEDIDAAHTYDYNSVTDAAPSASGEVVYPTITFTNGADMDSWADGELAIVRVGRDAANASDTMAADAELWTPEIRET